MKRKTHDLGHILFCIKHLVLVHNYGYYRSSLYHKLGMMGKVAEQHLRQKYLTTINKASMKWVPMPRNMLRYKYKPGQKMNNAEHEEIISVVPGLNPLRLYLLLYLERAN